MNLDRRIELHEPTQTQNSAGQYVVTYTLADTVWAALSPTYSGENTAADQLYGYVAARFVVRWRTDVTHLWRVLHNGVWYEVVGLLPDGRRTYLTLNCAARDNNAD